MYRDLPLAERIFAIVAMDYARENMRLARCCHPRIRAAVIEHYRNNIILARETRLQAYQAAHYGGGW